MKIGIFYQMLIMDQGFFALKKFVKLQIHVNTKVYKGLYEPLPGNSNSSLSLEFVTFRTLVTRHIHMFDLNMIGQSTSICPDIIAFITFRQISSEKIQKLSN